MLISLCEALWERTFAGNRVDRNAVSQHLHHITVHDSFVAVQPALSKCTVLRPQPDIPSSSVRLVRALDRAEAMWDRGEGEGVVLDVEDGARREHRPPLKAAAAIAPSPGAHTGGKETIKLSRPLSCCNAASPGTGKRPTLQSTSKVSLQSQSHTERTFLFFPTRRTRRRYQRQHPRPRQRLHLSSFSSSSLSNFRICINSLL